MQDTMEITTAVGCPNACTICPQERFVGRYGQSGGTRRLSAERFRLCLDKIPRHVRIDFSGFTEPWSNPECTDMVLHAHAAGFHLAAFTTCVGMNESDVERIRSVPFVAFVVHLPDSESVMPFPRVRNYKAVLKAVSASNLSNLAFMAMGMPHPDLQGLVPGDVSGCIRSGRAGNVTGSRPVRKAGPIRCIPSPNLRRNVLLPNGDVVLCCHDYSLENVLGNLLVCDYEDLFNGPTYKDILARQARETAGGILCRRCDWSGSPLKARSVWIREVFKESLQPIRQYAKRIYHSLPCPVKKSDRRRA